MVLISVLRSIRRLGPEILERILPIITARHPELENILQAVERFYLRPFRSPNPRLRLEDVGPLMRIDSIAELRKSCNSNPKGLYGILGEHKSSVPEPGAHRRSESSPPASKQSDRVSTALLHRASRAGSLNTSPTSDPLSALDYGNDNDAVYDTEQLLRPTPNPRVTQGNTLVTGPPTPPPTVNKSGVKRRTEAEHEESPIKRLAPGDRNIL